MFFSSLYAGIIINTFISITLFRLFISFSLPFYILLHYNSFSNFLQEKSPIINWTFFLQLLSNFQTKIYFFDTICYLFLYTTFNVAKASMLPNVAVINWFIPIATNSISATLLALGITLTAVSKLNPPNIIDALTKIPTIEVVI